MQASQDAQLEAGALGDREGWESAGAPRYGRELLALAACPHLRREVGAQLLPAAATPSDDHRCIAISGPRAVSTQQQELVCLRDDYANCPRHRRAAAASGRSAFRPPAIPRAIAISLLVLALSAGISFGFVLQRGGIDLPPTLAAATAAASVAAASPSTSPASAAATAPPSAAPSSAPPEPTPSASPEPPSAPPATASPLPTATASPAASPTPAPLGPTADRLAVISPCTGQPGCWIYHVRLGDNLWSIAHWFGIPLETVYAWNPTVKTAGIHPGDVLRIPTPTR